MSKAVELSQLSELLTVNANGVFVSSDLALDGEVGIGANSPSSKLHVKEAMTMGANAQTILVENTTTGNPVAIAMRSVADNGGLGNTGAIYFDAGADGSATNNKIAFNADHQTDNNYDMVLTGDGKFGIGTDTPIRTFHVETTSGIPARFSRTSSYNYDLKIDNLVTGDAIDYVLEPDQASSGYLWRTRNSSNNNITALAINKDGKVGIGQSVANYTLDVNGDINVGGNSEYKSTTERPDVRPKELLDFTHAKAIPGHFLFSRASSGTYTDENGILRTANNNVPRFDHDRWGNCLGLLTEHGSTNLHLNSEYYGATVIAGMNTASGRGLPNSAVEETIAPDGSTVPILASTTVTGGLYFYQNYSLATTTDYVFSCFFKLPKNNTLGVTGVIMYSHSNSFDGNDIVHYKFSTDEFITTPPQDGNTFKNYSRVLYPNGWVRISISAVTASTTGNFDFISHFTLDDSGNMPQGGTAGQPSGYVWGPQLEQQQFPTSYISTGSSGNQTATRTQDILYTVDYTNFNPGQGTFYVESASIGGDGSNQWMLTVGDRDNLGTNRLSMAINGAWNNATQRVVLAAPTAGTAAQNLTVNTLHSKRDDSVYPHVNKMAITYDVNTSANQTTVLNGTKYSSLSNFAWTEDEVQAWNRIEIGGYAGGGIPYSGWIRKVAYYNKAFTENQLITLTREFENVW